MKKISIKLIALLLLLTFMLFLASCKSHPIKTAKGDLVSVGTVGDYEITYEEIYFLAHNYRETLDAEYGKDAATSDEIITVSDDDGAERAVKLSDYYNEALSNLISENITANYAVLSLAEKAGISLEDEDIQDKIQNELDLYIENDFGGKRRAYKKYLDEHHMTDNYVRFSIGVDVIYSRLTTEYLNSGEIATEEEEIRKIINEEFILTRHVMLMNDKSTDYQTACYVLDQIRSGESSVYEMIGSKYNKDFGDTGNGYYFTKGSMDKAYEDAAFALEIGEVSDVVTAMGKDSYGNRVPCYYIIQRFALDQNYVNNNFEVLKSEYINSVVYKKMEAEQQSLEFTPNDVYDSLSLLELDEPRQTDTFTVWVLTSTLGGVAIVVGGIVFWVRHEKQKIKNRKKKA